MGPIKEMSDAGLKTARLEAENVTVELLQYTSEGLCFGREVMGGAEGYNHMALEVSDIEAAISGLKENGYKVLAGFPRQGSHGRVAFLDPATTEGILLELCEVSEAGSRTDH
jgi:methylmalonyl-CoA/ethylmalonyl-CoA epimerase